MMKWMQILWPSFLVACVMEMVVFSLVDPTDMVILKKQAEISAYALYSISFFIFWFFCALSSGLSAYLSCSRCSNG